MATTNATDATIEEYQRENASLRQQLARSDRVVQALLKLIDFSNEAEWLEAMEAMAAV